MSYKKTSETKHRRLRRGQSSVFRAIPIKTHGDEQTGFFVDKMVDNPQGSQGSPDLWKIKVHAVPAGRSFLGDFLKKDIEAFGTSRFEQVLKRLSVPQLHLTADRSEDADVILKKKVTAENQAVLDLLPVGGITLDAYEMPDKWLISYSGKRFSFSFYLPIMEQR